MNVSEIQRRRKELGIYAGAVNGKASPLTTATIRAFQSIHGLKADGIVGLKTIGEMSPRDTGIAAYVQRGGKI